MSCDDAGAGECFRGAASNHDALERFFAPLRMTTPRGPVIECANVMCFEEFRISGYRVIEPFFPFFFDF